MSRGLPLGTVLGARIELGWSWLAVFPIIVAAVLGAIDPAAGSAGLRTLVAVGGALVLLGSVLGHELGHVAVAFSHGIAVDRVAVFLLGGFSEMDLSGASPRQERSVAIAGPVVSAALGGLLWLASTAAPRAGGVDRVLLLLAVVNLGVAAFNLLPAFPLDGGRFARAALVSFGVERSTAERFAARSGLVLGSVIVVGAVVASLLGSPISLLALPVGVMVAVLGSASATSD